MHDGQQLVEALKLLMLCSGGGSIQHTGASPGSPTTTTRPTHSSAGWRKDAGGLSARMLASDRNSTADYGGPLVKNSYTGTVWHTAEAHSDLEMHAYGTINVEYEVEKQK